MQALEVGLSQTSQGISASWVLMVPFGREGRTLNGYIPLALQFFGSEMSSWYCFSIQRSGSNCPPLRTLLCDRGWEVTLNIQGAFYLNHRECFVASQVKYHFF